MKLGPYKMDQMGGIQPRDWSDLYAFIQMTEPIGPWQSETIIKMSKAYVRGLEEGQSPFGKSPVERMAEKECIEGAGN